MLLRVGEGNRSTLGSERRGTTFVVAAQPEGEVVGRADIERTIGTAEEVDVEGECLGALRLASIRALAQGTILLGRGGGEDWCPSTRPRLGWRYALARPRSGHHERGSEATESNGGGGGSRTRVRKRVAEGIYMRVRSCWFAPGVRERQKPPGASSDIDSPPRLGTERFS